MARSRARKLADLTSAGNTFDDGVISAAEVTGLGTAATTDATDYATAGQGTLAASALQPTGDGSGLTGIASSMATLTDATVSASYPLVSSNPSSGVGHLWVNSTSGDVFVLTDATAGSNIWINMGNGADNVGPFIATGGTITTAGGYTYHTFTSSGTFSITQGALQGISADILMVGGGGAGGSVNGYSGSGTAGAGGGGGYLEGSVTLAKSGGSTSLTVTVGAGCPRQGEANPGGFPNGGDTTLSGFLSATAIGGASAPGNDTSGSGIRNGRDGGSGSGNSDNANGGESATTGGSSTQADSGGLTAFGNDGGFNGASSSGGGGGAGAAASGSSGGIGRDWESLGTVYAGGGSAVGQPAPAGGGGSGGVTNGTAPSGTANTGGGGGGGRANNTFGNGGAGGSGIVIIRYLTP